MDIIDRLKSKIREFFRREVVYNIQFLVEEKARPLDYHLPIEVEFGDRLRKVER